ncbi:unnamed protein product, partial [Medioppia subpectinata]
FGKCPVDKYPGIALESVSDSSRYFVIRLQDDNGRNAFIGIGFTDRGDSFDLNVALQDHFKGIQKEEEIEKEPPQDSQPKLDLGFKDGQTIKVNLNIAKRSGSGSASSRPRVKPVGGGLSGGILLPPPPGATKAGQTKTTPAVKPTANTTTTTTKSDNDFLLDLESLSIGSTDTTPNDTKTNTSNTNSNSNDLFGDFESMAAPKAADTSADPWAQFQ